MQHKNINFKKCSIPLMLTVVGIGGMFSYLTFVPEQVSAAYDWETRKISDISTMQEMNAKICENSAENESKPLKDVRDNKLYYVTKLKDGNCWMTQNLAYNGGGTATSVSSWPSSGNPSIYNQGSHTDGSHTSQGNYYSFDAANSSGGTDGDASSVCPANWQLPTGGNTNSKSFGGLTNAYGIGNDSDGSTKLHSSPLYFQCGGALDGGYLRNSGYYGYYWSSTPNGSDRGYHLNFGSGDVHPSSATRRYSGFSVRCVARDDVYPEEPPLDSNSQANVAITVSPVISIDVTQHVDEEVDFTKVAKSEIVARVGSNQPYQVLFSTDKSALTNTNIEQSIPMVTSDQKIVAGTSNWGIKKLSSASDTVVDADTIYSPVGIGDNKALFYTSNVAAAEDLTFPVAIAVDAALPSGKYSTQVTLTAVAM